MLSAAYRIVLCLSCLFATSYGEVHVRVARSARPSGGYSVSSSSASVSTSGSNPGVSTRQYSYQSSPSGNQYSSSGKKSDNSGTSSAGYGSGSDYGASTGRFSYGSGGDLTFNNAYGSANPGFNSVTGPPIFNQFMPGFGDPYFLLQQQQKQLHDSLCRLYAASSKLLPPMCATRNYFDNGVLPTNAVVGNDPSVFTSGAITFDRNGGYGVATSVPGGEDGLGVRIAEEFPAPSGGTFGTFSSSSSGVTSVNGQTKSFKTSTVGVNDNGRIIFRTVNE